MSSLRKSRWAAALLAGAPLCAHAASSCERSTVPDWAAKAILAYPKPAERPAMLVAALEEHYDTRSIAAVDVELVLLQLAPAMLGARSPDELKARIERTMALFHCESTARNAGASTTNRVVANADTFLPREETARAVEALVNAHAPQNADDASPKSAGTLAAAAGDQDRAGQLDTLAKASDQALGELTKNTVFLERLSAKNCAKDRSGRKVAADEFGDAGCLAARTQDLGDANRRSYHVIVDANKIATTASAGGAAAESIKQDYAAAHDWIARSTSLVEARLPRYGLYVGPTYSLSNDGSWKSGGEFLARFESAVLDHTSYLCPPIAAWCRTGSEFSYRTLAALDKKSGDPAAAPNAKADADESLNPFAQSGGIFRYTGAMQMHFSDTFGVMGLAGVTGLHTDTTDGVRTRPRFGAGVHFQTLYGEGGLGQLFAGYVNDRVWDRPVPLDRTVPDGATRTQKNYDRWVIDGLFFIPDIDVGGFQLVARLTADTPINRRGPSDVRASLLLHHDLNGWISAHAPKKGDE
ncbi:MAG TPA: hypothetical protein VGC30_02395 [Dokdonella sp.]